MFWKASDVQCVSKKMILCETRFSPQAWSSNSTHRKCWSQFFLSSYGTNLDLKFEAIFRKSCWGLFEEKCVFWVTDFGTSHFFLRHPVNFSRSNNYSGVAWIKKSIFTTPNVKTDNITLWATSRPKNWCGLIWCYGL